MPSPIPVPVRQVIFQRWQQGASVPKLAEELDLCERTVRHLVQRFAGRGQAGVNPDYARCATKALATDSSLFHKAVHMRQQHPTWGAGLICVLLQEELGACRSERTLQRWFRRTALSPAPPGRRPASDAYRARRAHEVWQMDAAERILLANGERVSWLRLVDECSGAVVQTTIFPPRALEPGGTDGGPTGVAPGFFQVGTARAVPSGQRHALGIGGRLADRFGAVVDRFGNNHDLESATTTAGQRRGRTLARHGQTLGRAQNVSRCGRVAAPAGRHGPHPTRGLSEHRRP